MKTKFWALVLIVNILTRLPFHSFLLDYIDCNFGGAGGTQGGQYGGNPGGPGGQYGGNPGGQGGQYGGNPGGNQGGHYGGNPGGGSGGGKPQVIISFDSMNIQSMQFFAHQLQPIYEEFSPCVTWSFIPCSTSKIVNDVLHCCNGVMECQIDVLHACAAHYYENDQYKLGKFFLCMMTDNAEYVKGEQCANEAGMNWKMLDQCQPSKDAGFWCNERYKQLNMLHERAIPGVMYNMHYDAAAELESTQNLKTGICNQIKKQGGQCSACGNCGSGGGSVPGTGGSHPPGSGGHPP